MKRTNKKVWTLLLALVALLALCVCIASAEGETGGAVVSCGDNISDHTPGEPVEVTTAATCKEEGRVDSVVYCEVCGEELSRELIRTLPKRDHFYTEKSLKWADNFKSVTVAFICIRCGDIRVLSYDENTAKITKTVNKKAKTATYTIEMEFNGQTFTNTKTVSTEFRCDLCDLHEKYPKNPVITAFHTFVHLVAYLTKR